MADFNILFAATSKAVIGSVPLDASIRESHEQSAEVTKNPVESGGNISDHVFDNPNMLTIEGFITDSPVRFLSGVRTFIEGRNAAEKFENVRGLQFPGGSQSKTRHMSAFRALSKLKADKQPITVITGLVWYPDMIITRFNVDRDKTRGQALWFTMSFEQISIVDSQLIAVDPETIASTQRANDQAQNTQEAGKQGTQAAGDNDTIFFNIYESGTDLTGLVF